MIGHRTVRPSPRPPFRLHYINSSCLTPGVQTKGEGEGGGKERSDTTLINFSFFICYSHPRLRQDDMVRPCGRVGYARAAARARGELPRVRACARRTFFC